MENATPVFVFVVVKFLRGSVPYKALKSGSGQSGCADIECKISFLIKRCFMVAQDENLSYEKV